MRDSLLQYLTKIHVDDIKEVLAFIEGPLANFMKDYVNSGISCIYDVTDITLCKEVRAKMQTDPEFKAANRASGDNRLSQALKQYIGFLESPYYPRQKESFKQSKPVAKPLPKEAELTEGAKKHMEQERSQRNPKLRQVCIAHYGFVCQVCGFDFEKAYGEIGKDFIEVHHLNPISNYSDEHGVDPIKDLVPLCSNCHSMIHHGPNGLMTLKEIRGQYKGIKWAIPVKMED